MKLALLGRIKAISSVLLNLDKIDLGSLVFSIALLFAATGIISH